MKISVYITSYNQRSFLQEAIESVLAQTYQPFEIIIIDDFSTDGSRDLISSYHEKYPNLIKPLLNKKNLGISKCRNLGIEHACGEYLTWLDGDDVYLPRKLEVQVDLIKKGDFDCCFTNFFFSNESINDIFQVWCCNVNDLPSAGIMFKEVLTRKFPRNSLFRYEMVNLDFIKGQLKYDTSINLYEDYDFRIRLSKNVKINYTFEPLSIYRNHDNGLSKVSRNIHHKTLSYIFNKYESEVSLLSEEDQQQVRMALGRILRAYSPKDEDFSLGFKLKKRIKSNLIDLIKKI